MKARAAWGMAVVLSLVGCGSSSGSSGLHIIRHSTSPTVSDAPIFVAVDQGFFKQNGVDLKLQLSPSGVDGAQLVSGAGDVENLGFNQVADLQSQGKKVIAVYALIRRATVDMVVSNKALAAKGLSPDEPLGDRLHKLKGLRFGITAPQTANDVATRYLLKQGGYNPDSDAQIISVGSFAGQTSALESNQIDAFVGPPPVPKQVVLRGEGKILISSSSGEVPGLANYYFANLTMRSDFVTSNPEATRAYVKSMRQAYAWMLTHRDEALKSVERRLPNIDAATIALGYDEIFVTLSPDGKYTPEYAQSTLDVLKQGGVLESPPSAAEGIIWTNQYNQ